MTEDCMKDLDNWLSVAPLSGHPKDNERLFIAIKNCILHDVKSNEVKYYIENNARYKNIHFKDITKDMIQDLLLMVENAYYPMLYFHKGIIDFS